MIVFCKLEYLECKIMKYVFGLLIIILFIGCKEEIKKRKTELSKSKARITSSTMDMTGKTMKSAFLMKPKLNIVLVKTDTISTDSIVKTWKLINDPKTIVKVGYKFDTARKLCITKQKRRTVIDLVGGTTSHFLPLNIKISKQEKLKDSTLLFELQGKVLSDGRFRLFRLIKNARYLQCSYGPT